MDRTKQVRLISEADLDRMAEEAEAGYDLQAWRRRPGRPALHPSSLGHAPRIGTRVPEPLKAEFDRLVKAEGKNTSEKLRELVEAYVGEGVRAVDSAR